MFIKTKLVSLITFGFAAGITLFPFIFVRPEVPLTRRLVVHEKIHLQQQAELLVLPFYLLYFFEYLYRLIQFENHYLAYRNISFEKEAYENEQNPRYLQKRLWWNWIKYL